jgi:O-acetyl-ADP-ribose deacetylase (regulator of RNase III)
MFLTQKKTFSNTYLFPNGKALRIVSGDIISQAVDAIVSSDDSYLSMGGGVSAAIGNAAGPEFVRESHKFVPARAGRVVVTSAGRLNARFVFHGVTIENADPSLNIISEILAGCFHHADTLYVKRIAFPLLGTGAGGFPRDVCLDTMVNYLAKKLLQGLTTVEEASIVLAGPVEILRHFLKG